MEAGGSVHSNDTIVFTQQEDASIHRIASSMSVNVLSIATDNQTEIDDRPLFFEVACEGSTLFEATCEPSFLRSRTL